MTTDLTKALLIVEQLKVEFCFEERCFVWKGNKRKYIKGLLPTLRKYCWPKYEYTPLRYNFGKKTGINGMRHGMNRGQYVHEQFRVYFNKGKTIAKKMYSPLHPFVRRGIKKLKLLKLRPIIAELPIYDPDLNLATSIDLVCLTAEDNVMLVEWKIGMDNHFFRGTGPMLGPQIKVESTGGCYNNSPHSQALWQILFGKLILEKTYINSDVEACVINIQKDNVIQHCLPKKILAEKNNIYLYCLLKNEENNNNQTKKLPKTPQNSQLKQ